MQEKALIFLIKKWKRKSYMSRNYNISSTSFKAFYAKGFKMLILGLVVITFLSSCKSNRSIIKSPIKEYGADYLFEKLKENELQFEWISAKFNIDLVIDNKKNSFRGQLRMRRDSAIWISFSPALGIEMARILITNDSVKFINRINKTYFSGDYQFVHDFIGTNVDYDVLQSVLLGNDLTYYEDGKFRASYDSKEYHLVTGGRSKLKKYVKNKHDEERIYLQNIFLNPETFKITKMKIKEVKKESKKLDAFYDDFQNVEEQLFPHHLSFDITAETPVWVDMNYSKISINQPLLFPFKITSKYARIQ